MSEFTINIVPNTQSDSIRVRIPTISPSSTAKNISKLLEKTLPSSSNLLDFPSSPRRSNDNADISGATKLTEKPSSPKAWDKDIDKKWQKFYRHVAEILNSDRAAIIFGELRGRFVSSKKPRIYKFISPCSHKLYKPGDSLAEEMGIDNKMGVIRALEPIRTKYSSKSSYSKALKELGEDGVFRGMPFLTFYDRGMSLLYFEMNERIVKEIISGKWVKPSLSQSSEPSSEPSNEGSRNRQNVIPEVTSEVTSEVTFSTPDVTSQKYQNVTSEVTNLLLGTPLEPAPDKALEGASKNTAKNTDIYLNDVYTVPDARAVHTDDKKLIEVEQPVSSTPSPSRTFQNISYATEVHQSPPAEQALVQVSSQMFDIYSATMKAHGSAHAKRNCDRPTSAETKNHLHAAYTGSFGSDMSQWKAYCKSLTTSKFLMGEVTSKGHDKPWELMLSGVCKREMIEKVNSGRYGIGDRIAKEEAVPTVLKEFEDSDATVLKFRSKCIEIMGEARYKSMIQPAGISSGGDGEIHFVSDSFPCSRMSSNDQFGFTSVLKALGLKKMTITDRKGKTYDSICVEKHARQPIKFEHLMPSNLFKVVG